MSYISVGKPDPLTNCTVSNQTTMVLLLECSEGFDGGLTQTFDVEVFYARTRNLVTNQSSKWVHSTIHSTVRWMNAECVQITICCSLKCWISYVLVRNWSGVWPWEDTASLDRQFDEIYLQMVNTNEQTLWFCLFGVIQPNFQANQAFFLFI